MPENINIIVDHFFRNEYGKAVSHLTNKFGVKNLELVEDAVQEALYKAIKNWSLTKVPNNPSGWIFTVASNKIIDVLRKNKFLSEQEKIKEDLYENLELDPYAIQDDLVKMMFACCHPSISKEYQIILTLKILSGFSVKEIARALLKKEETIAKGYTRAKKEFKKRNEQLIIPSNSDIKSRLRIMLQIIYLMFNEGYKKTSGDKLIEEDLCGEAIRLTTVLLGNEECNTSEVNALMALMCFHSSRFQSRVDGEGNLVTLENQNRENWDQSLIDDGIKYLKEATSGNFMNEYYIQAAISGLHCEAKSYADTNWKDILELYNALVSLNPSPMIKLNRAVALGKAKSVEEALKRLKELEENEKLQNHYLLYAIRGSFLVETGELKKGKRSLEKAINLTNNKLEKKYLKRKIEAIGV